MVEKERNVQIKQYGLHNPKFRAVESPSYKSKENAMHERREADRSTPKSRSNYGTSMLKALAIALNNQWQWYGRLYLSNEEVTSFDALRAFLKTFISRLRQMRHRSTEKNFSYLIVPDVELQNGVSNWFVHVWFMNFPNEEKIFAKELVLNVKITYHWTRLEKQYGKTELYKIYNSGYATNGKYMEQIAYQIYDIIERTSPLTPKETNLYYASDNVTRDIIIAEGHSVLDMPIPDSPKGNGFTKSIWLDSLDEAMKYITIPEQLTPEEMRETWEEIKEYIRQEQGIEPDELPEPSEENDVSCYDENPFSEPDNHENIIAFDDDFPFYGGTEDDEPVEDFDYSVLNDIYENEVYNYD